MTKTIAEMFHEDWTDDSMSFEDCMKKLLDCVEERITALEHPVQQAWEWMTGNENVWRAYFNPAINKWTVDKCIVRLLETGDLWMPYIPGMKKPDPPSKEVTK